MGKVTIIGGGNGAFAAASDLTIRGNQVTLFELPQFAAGVSREQFMEYLKHGC